MPGSNKAHSPTRERTREIRRNCGQLLGNLEEILPFLYVAQRGAPLGAMRARTMNAAPGLFAVSSRIQDASTTAAAHFGLVLPVHLCRDQSMRNALLKLPDLIDGHEHRTLSDRRRSVEAFLNDCFGGDLVLDQGECLDRFFGLKPGPGLFKRLSDSFDFVTEMIDDPDGKVRISATSPFRWHSYGELMEWYHCAIGSDRFGTWSTLTPFFVAGNMASLRSYSRERWARAGLSTPIEEPSRWFLIRPDVRDAPINFRLEMKSGGWAVLYLSLADATAEIDLSEVFDPFDELVAWGREIDEGDLPIQMEIDEEGEESVLTVLRTADPARVLLRVTRKYCGKLLLEGIVARTALAHAIKSELRRFFTSEFRPEDWDMDADVDRGDGYMQTRDRVLQHVWLNTSDPVGT